MIFFWNKLIEYDLLVEDYALKKAVEFNQFKIVQYLVKNGANIHVESNWPLRYAACRNCFEIVKFLVKNGADIHAYDDWSLSISVQNGNLKTVKFLLDNGANLNNRFILYDAAKYNRVEVFKYLLEKGAGISDKWEYNAILKDAKQKKYFKIIELLNLLKTTKQYKRIYV